jgi:alkanesulfonate monooxygenase
MPLHFHWFLPTTGDGRDIVGGGHGVATGSAGAIRPASLIRIGGRCHANRGSDR